MFEIFKKSKRYDLSWLGVDMHAHLLVGLDDGCESEKIAIECMEGLQELGYHTVFATPHVFSEMYPNTTETISQGLNKLRASVQQHESLSALSLGVAAEYMIDDQFSENYTEKVPLTLPGNHLLIEMSYQFERQDFYEHLFQLQLREIKPILAHPERYSFYHNTPQVYARIKERGCKFQLNLLSLSGYYGQRVRKMAQHLVKEGMIDYIGTDLHHLKHLHAIRQFATTHDLQKLFASSLLQNRDMALE